MSKKKNKKNIEKIIDAFNDWTRRFEEGEIIQLKDGNFDFSWGIQDWVQWGIDISDAISDIYSNFKALALLYQGILKVIYEDLEEEEKPNLLNMDAIKRIYS